MWTTATTAQHGYSGLRYEIDLTDGEWAVIWPLRPQSAVVGRPANWPLRRIVEGVFCVLRTGRP